MVARVESLQGGSRRLRLARRSGTPSKNDGAGVEGLSPEGDASQFESLLSESFGGHQA